MIYFKHKVDRTS